MGKHLTILVPDMQAGPNTISCIIGAYHIFSGANNYRIEKGNEPVFDIQLAGVAMQSSFIKGLLQIQPQCKVTDIKATDLVIIPAVAPDFNGLAKENEPLIRFMNDQYKQGAELACMCTGAYLLASTGLLDQRHCSLHWNTAAHFKRLFPKVKVQPDKLITDENGIYTNGGGYSFLNLILYLVEKFYDRATAVYCSKIFQIDIDRHTQSDFVIFAGQKSHDDPVVKLAQQYIEDNYYEKISFEALSRKYAVGRRNFDRRFIKATGNTPLEYLQRVKIESAKKALESTRKTISEVMYETGYADMKAFREIFRKVTGLSPLAYKSKYNKESDL
ncbi:GlxA family transcriptional regulator [Niabella hibiscisoli]|uniref:GlxA family transcriptional regulator n=1 Tax=Niabella hibiscisoli TaxID=1825928 RepID=UPI001F11856D|nr:helix-turn-helix domain-containing protein [Niabella hibiscisoli]MCH5719512.1 helix-turn-helix domain-containing protein [Niabella hibiscisoli]